MSVESPTTSVPAPAIPVRIAADIPNVPSVHIFGAGESGQILRALIEKEGRTTVAGFIDNHKSGECGDVRIVDLQNFVSSGCEEPVMVASEAYAEIVASLRAAGVRHVYDAFPLIARERQNRLMSELAALSEANRRLQLDLDYSGLWYRDRGNQIDILRFFLDLQTWQNRALCGELYGPPEYPAAPPFDIPAEMLDRYTMDGRVRIEHLYCRDTVSSNYPRIYTQEEVNSRLELLNKREEFAYRGTDRHLFDALDRNPIRGQEVAVIGSISPWFESVCLHYGGRPTTIEYNPIISYIPGHRAMTPAAWAVERPVFDAAFSISSFEHDGLGRYGDPLDPDGDLKAMALTKTMVKPRGLLFLAVPIGQDRVVFNAHRVYGRVRLPLLLAGWTIIDSAGGFEDSMLDDTGTPQPVLVLRND